MKLGSTATLNVEAISTGSISLDMALGIGGVPRGRIVEIYDRKVLVRPLLPLHIVAQAKKAGGEAAFIDVEHALDPVYAKALGVDIDSLWYPSRIPVNRLWKLPKRWSVPAQLM